MGKLKIKSLLKKKKVEKIKPKTQLAEKKAKKDEPIEQEYVKKGYAKRGDLIATIKPGVLGKDGRNVFDEKIPVKRVYEPRLIAGKNVKLDHGFSYYIICDGIVEVQKDKKDAYYIQGKRYRFGHFKVTVSGDEMKAWLMAIPPIGGAESIHPEEVLSNCKKQGIVFGLKEDVIYKTIKKAEEDRIVINDILIAEGENPVDGIDGKLEFKVKLASGKKFKALEGGSVDYREHDIITSVDKGELIAVVIRAQDGIKDGHTITGEVIKPKDGRDVEITLGNNITASDKGDSISYYSSIGGQLITDRNEISVEPLLTIEEDIGPETGNINFDGIVLIKGNVKDNYRVYAKKDITIQGNVGRAVVKSGENITVQNGIVGKNKCLVFAQGDITVKFAENSNLRAGGNIYIRRAALNCRCMAGNRIISKSEKGQLIGGELKAKKGIEVKILGNDSEHKTDVFVGSDFFLETRLQELGQEKKKYAAGLKKILLLIDKLNKITSNQDEVPDKFKKIYTDARKKKTLLGIAINDLRKKEQEYLLKSEELIDSEVIVHESLFRGVKIYFGKAFFEPEITKTRVKILYDKNYEKIKIVNI